VTSADVPRRTKQRAVIAAAFDCTNQWMTAQQVHQHLIESGQPVGLATVYRTLAGLAEAGEIDIRRTETEATYRRCSPTHHHHLTCCRCGATVEFSALPMEQWTAAVAAEHGYTFTRHVIEISGVCPSCQ